MRDQTADRFLCGDGPDDDVLAEFGLSRQGFVRRLREILLHGPLPRGLTDADVAVVLAACS